MSTGLILLVVVGILIGFGVAQRVLDRLRLTDRQALFFVGVALIGGLLPDVPLGDRLSVNLGGALIPVGLSIYLLIRAGSAWERTRAILASLITAAVIYFLGRALPEEPEAVWMDYNYLYGLAGGLAAWLFGRSRRGAFVAGVLGAVGADLWTATDIWRQGLEQPLILGGAGAADVIVISGLTAVLLAELVGEVAERIARAVGKPRTREFVNGEFRERRREKP